MSNELLDWILHFRPINPGDPGPEIYKFLNSLPVERQVPVVEAINTARGALEAARSKGYSQISQAVAAAAQGASGKR